MQFGYLFAMITPAIRLWLLDFDKNSLPQLNDSECWKAKQKISGC